MTQGDITDMVSIREEASYKNYGKCLSISNGLIEMLITVDVGPRIIRCSHMGKENLMFEDIGRTLTHDVSSLYGEGKTWNIYGGHRLWFSPETFPATYYPDNEKVVYTTNSHGAEFIPKQQDETGLQLSVSVEMDDNEPKLSVTHTITNAGKARLTGSAWALSVLDAGGIAIVPLSKKQTGLLPSRNIVLWDYTDMTDDRLLFGKDAVAVRQDSSKRNPLKIGIGQATGKIAYINHGQALIKEYDADDSAAYPDFGASTEIYTCPSFTEAETLSPLMTIGEWEKIVHTERWTLVDNVASPEFTGEAVAALAEKLF